MRKPDITTAKTASKAAAQRVHSEKKRQHPIQVDVKIKKPLPAPIVVVARLNSHKE
jgi:hypothetical protein